MAQHDTTSITPEDVIEAFGKSERFQKGTSLFGVFAPFISDLIPIIGDKIDEKITIAELTRVNATFLRQLATNTNFTKNMSPLLTVQVRSAFYKLARQFDEWTHNTDALLAKHDLTETKVMENMLGSDALERYRSAGKLTFAELLTTSPEIFIPNL